MDESFEALTAEAVAVLRQAGARFAYLHGSRATGQNRADSDIDIAAYFGGRPPNAFDVLLPPGVDLLILDDAPLELAGLVAIGGRLLFEDDQVARIRWDRLRYSPATNRTRCQAAGSSMAISRVTVAQLRAVPAA
jgi:predicted nucleotidyltransferase